MTMKKIFNSNKASSHFIKEVQHTSLGKTVHSTTTYTPSLLKPITRSTFQDIKDYIYGQDIWNCYELLWLTTEQLPKAHICTIIYNHSSPNIVESKSLKLYLATFAHTTFQSEEAVIDTIQTDLENIIQSPVHVTLTNVNQQNQPSNQNNIRCIDTNISKIHHLSTLEFSDKLISDTCCSHVFQSCCPVTNQPDYATIIIHYSGNKLSDQSLFEYLIGFKNHQHFHEQCINEIFHFLHSHNEITSLTVQGMFTRRGGIDINPIRSTYKNPTPFARIARQ